MTVKTMEDLFVETLKDIYYAEKHILKALPGMVKKAGNQKLRDALETHRQETEGQVDRLEQVFRIFDIAPRGKKCEAIEGIIAEAKAHMEDIEDPEGRGRYNRPRIPCGIEMRSSGRGTRLPRCSSCRRHRRCCDVQRAGI